MFRFLFVFVLIVGGYWYALDTNMVPQWLANGYAVLVLFFAAIFVSVLFAGFFGRKPEKSQIVKWG